jgi:hypothetical protein
MKLSSWFASRSGYAAVALQRWRFPCTLAVTEVTAEALTSAGLHIYDQVLLRGWSCCLSSSLSTEGSSMAIALITLSATLVGVISVLIGLFWGLRLRRRR